MNNDNRKVIIEKNLYHSCGHCADIIREIEDLFYCKRELSIDEVNTKCLHCDNEIKVKLK